MSKKIISSDQLQLALNEFKEKSDEIYVNQNIMTTAGDLIVGGPNGTPSRLAKGTAGQVLTMNSGATAPEWSDGGTKLFYHRIILTSGNLKINLEIFDTKSTPYEFTEDDELYINNAISGRILIEDTTGGYHKPVYGCFSGNAVLLYFNGELSFDPLSGLFVYMDGADNKMTNIIGYDEWAASVASLPTFTLNTVTAL